MMNLTDGIMMKDDDLNLGTFKWDCGSEWHRVPYSSIPYFTKLAMRKPSY